MNKYLLSLGLAIGLLLTSCNSDDGLPLTPDLVTEVNAFDLDNNGNSSDIRVDFEVENNLNVTEYRIMVVPTSSSNSFNQDIAVSIPKDNYLVIDPVPFETEYSINRLSSTLLDVNGDLIINSEEYVVAILVEGTGNFQLSEFSRPFTLLNQGIYGGYYEGNGCCVRVVTANFVVGDDFRPSILSGQLGGAASNYQGAIEGIHGKNTSVDSIDTSIIRFNVVNDTISDFNISGRFLGEALEFFDPGSGMVINDLLMEISLNSNLGADRIYKIQLRRVY